MHRRSINIAALAAVALALAACGSDDDETTASTSATTAPVVTTAATPSTSVAATAPPTTAAPASSAASTVTTGPATSTAPSVGVSWSPAEPTQFVGLLACCGANATGSPSPSPSPTDGALADGIYAMTVEEWSVDDPGRLLLGVRRFVPCADAVEGCSPGVDGGYRPDEVGLAGGAEPLEVTLDESVTVLLSGLGTPAANPDGTINGITAATDGAGFADLMSSLARAYDAEIGGALVAGRPPADIVADLRANPRGGFSSAAGGHLGELLFSDGAAPSVLFQAITDFEPPGAPLPRSGTSAMIPVAFEVGDGALILYFYAGFRS